MGTGFRYENTVRMECKAGSKQLRQVVLVHVLADSERGFTDDGCAKRCVNLHLERWPQDRPHSRIKRNSGGVKGDGSICLSKFMIYLCRRALKCADVTVDRIYEHIDDKQQ